jgi:hypothetical protein
VPYYGNKDTLTGSAVYKANATTVNSRTVFGPFALGMRLNLSKTNIETPGIVNVGRDNKILEKAV